MAIRRSPEDEEKYARHLVSKRLEKVRVEADKFADRVNANIPPDQQYRFNMFVSEAVKLVIFKLLTSPDPEGDEK